MKTILSGWFIIKAMLPVDGGYLYQLEEPKHNYHISLESKTALPYGPDHWIKAQMVMTCEDAIDYDEVQTNQMILQLAKTAHFCEAETFVELKCTERNSFVMNGIRFC